MSSPAPRPRRILLGVTGSVGAFKSVLLLRRMRLLGWEVKVVMSAAATRFVGEATFHALSGHPVATDMWALDRTIGGELHVELSGWADAMIVYPATANFVGGLASGLADDLIRLTAACFRGPLLVCPAMHARMATSPLHARAVATLEEAGIRVLPPVQGVLANGEVGTGRLPEPEVALEALRSAMLPQDLAGRHVVVSAGPTREPIDAVRFLSNPSTGRMGFAIARVAARRGARVTLVAGPVSLECPPGVALVPVTTAAEMADAVRGAAEDADAVVMAAAVADFRAADPSQVKVPKASAELTLALERTRDILAGLGAEKRGRVLVGFAMETGDLVEKAQAKLAGKNLDLLVANDLTVPGAGFGTATNVVTLLHRDGRREDLPLMDKEDLAEVILDRVAELLAGRQG